MISVIVPAYNAEQFLAECLDSLLSQTFGDWEAIVVDDGSTDTTPSIARAYASRDPRIHTFTKPNGGLSDARNFGIVRASGEYITFLDADDCLYPDAIRIFHHNAGRADIVAAGVRLATNFTPSPSPASPGGRITGSLEALEEGLYQTGFLLSAWGKLYRAADLAKIRFTKGTWYEDLDFMPRLLTEVSTVLNINTPLYFYRQNPGSFIHTYSDSRLHVLRVTEEVERYIGDRSPALLPAARDRRLSANFNMFSLLSRHGSHPEVRRECWEIIRSYRRESLLNPRVRIKNKLGILLSFLGCRTFGLISGILK